MHPSCFSVSLTLRFNLSLMCLTAGRRSAEKGLFYVLNTADTTQQHCNKVSELQNLRTYLVLSTVYRCNFMFVGSYSKNLFSAVPRTKIPKTAHRC